MRRHGLATILEDHPEGFIYHKGNPPLHLTHIDAFDIDMAQNALENLLQNFFAKQKVVITRALSDVYYGAEKNILVTEVELNSDLRRLHSAIVEMLEDAGATFKSPHWIRDNFRPHVTVTPHKRIKPGDEIIIREVSMGKIINNDDTDLRRTLANFSLGA